MPLLSFPNELLFRVANYLDAPGIYSIVITNRYFAELFYPTLLKFALKDTYCATVLTLAAAESDEKMVRYLLEKGAPLIIQHQSHPQYDSSLRLPQNRINDVVQCLLGRISKSTILDKLSRRPPLYMAAKFGRSTATRLLLEHCANALYRDPLGQIPLHQAIANGHENIVKLHLDHGIDPNILCENGWTALHWAVMKQNENIVELLLDYGYSVNVSGSKGWTPLHWAAMAGPESIVKLLLERGADANARDRSKFTPSTLAAIGNRKNVLTILQEVNANAYAHYCEMSRRCPECHK